jgi:hypothetical protein
MQGRREEAEVIVRFDQVEGKCHICVSSWPSMARKMARLYGEPLPKSGRQAHYWSVPLKAITFRRLVTVERPRRVPSTAFKPGQKRQFGKTSAAAGTSAP